MPSISKRAFIFDEWKQLAESNPEAFEFTRQKMIDSLISEARDAERLKRLQWRIDIERHRSSNPMSACVRISSMMFDSLYGKAGLANVLQGNYEENPAPAEVVSMSKFQSKHKE